ncbi:MAG: hypothetical protein ACYCVL_12745 [Gemmatimonadaceae bacterium]
MKKLAAFAGIAAMVGLGAFACARPTTRSPSTHVVMAHCPAGTNAAFVTPESVTVAVRDSVRWKTTGQAVDSIIITLKNAGQTWPFTGSIPRGGDSTQTGGADTTGTYPYSVTLHCRVANQPDTVVVIDPDIIIQ